MGATNVATVTITTDELSITIQAETDHFSLGDSGFQALLARLHDLQGVAPLTSFSATRDGKLFRCDWALVDKRQQSQVITPGSRVRPTRFAAHEQLHADAVLDAVEELHTQWGVQSVSLTRGSRRP